MHSPAGSMNRATGDLEQLECSYRGELDFLASTSEAQGVVETQGTATVAVRITVEAANEPAVNVEAVVERWLRGRYRSEEAKRDIEFEEAAQIDAKLERLREIFEVEVAAQQSE